MPVAREAHRLSQEEPKVFLLAYEEALVVLGEQAVRTASWRIRGYYAKNCISMELRAGLLPFEGRWDWLLLQLKKQKTSEVE